MEELGSMWSYQEGIDELKHKLLYTTLELEAVKAEANDEIKKSKENVTSLLNLLKVAYQERDEARDQLQNLLNKYKPCKSPITEPHTILPNLQPESPLIVIPAKANSSITESNSLSETINHQSHNSSPVDSFFDAAVSSPDFNNMADSCSLGNFVNHQPFVQDYNVTLTGAVATGLLSSVVTSKVDAASAVFDDLVKGKALPEKGKLLQTVMEAGPLLQTLLVSGPLPRWRNPPPLQTFKIPPVSIKGCDGSTSFTNQNLVSMNPSYGVQKLLNSSSFFEMSCGSSLSSGRVLTSGATINNQIPLSKRQRFQ